jgi:transcriptional regulator with XRE-family HTH domain
MSERDAFGPNLRRLRVQRGISLDQIAASTKVGVDLWSALEQNDFSQWPTGIYARAYVRAYAEELGIDADAIVEEFCRSFPAGDRRAERVIRGHAEIVGHDLRWRDDLVGSVTEERRSSARAQDASALPTAQITQIARIAAATLDLLAITAAAAVGATLLRGRWGASIAVCAIAYNAVSLVALGCTPAVWAAETYLVNRHPHAKRAGRQRFQRLVRSAHRVKA